MTQGTRREVATRTTFLGFCQFTYRLQISLRNKDKHSVCIFGNRKGKNIRTYKLMMDFQTRIVGTLWRVGSKSVLPNIPIYPFRKNSVIQLFISFFCNIFLLIDWSVESLQVHHFLFFFFFMPNYSILAHSLYFPSLLFVFIYYACADEAKFKAELRGKASSFLFKIFFLIFGSFFFFLGCFWL